MHCPAKTESLKGDQRFKSSTPRLAKKRIEMRVSATGKIYDCLQQAADAVGLASKGSIYIACKNPNRTAKGYHWKYI